MKINKTSSTPLQLAFVSVEKLFGSLTHKIPLSDEGITFVHGPNGSGKTATLNLIEAALGRDLVKLRSTWFQKLTLHFSDGSGLCIERESREAESIASPKTAIERQELTTLIFIRLLFDKQSEKFIEKERKAIQPSLFSEFSRVSKSPRITDQSVRLSRFIDQYLPFLERMALRQWKEKESGQLLSYTDVLEMYGDRLPFLLPEWVNDLCRRVNLNTIKAQRLLNISTQSTSIGTESQQKIEDSVNVNAQELSMRIERAIAEATWASQANERSFPRRIILGERIERKDEGTLRDEYKALERKIQGLVDTGLYTDTVSIELPEKKLTPTHKTIVALYLADMSEKLQNFDSLQSRLIAFREIIGAKLQRKTIIVDRQKGYYFKTTTTPEVVLNPSALSSGEQHQIVMFYKLLFSSAESSLFLIDEPEISLHVEWQRQFLSDLTRVSSLMGHTFLVATHSPQVINSRFDLAVGLNGGISK
jgi:energy-coupling factor transporter ATP-binding protein EcfA2